METSIAKKKKKTVKRSLLKKPAKQNKKDLSVFYNQFKTFDGKQYTGMEVGRSHKRFIMLSEVRLPCGMRSA